MGTYISLTVAFGLLIAAILILGQFAYGAPFMPTHRKTVMDMLSLGNEGKKMVDLGSGDGRIVIAFAEAGVEAHGFEMNPLLVMWSRWKIRRAGLRGKAFIHQGNFFRTSFSSFDVVTVFGMDHIMEALSQKIRKEMKSGTVVLSNAFRFPDWEHEKKVGTIFLYRV